MRIENLCKTYQIKKGTSVNALSHITLDLPETGMIFILGKSGSGKSTLLKLLAGLEAPTEGEIYFHGKNLATCSVKELDSYRNTYCGFIFQEYNLIPELNVGDNIALALQMQGEKDTKEKVEEVLRQVELSGYEKRKISELSGGQRQRVAIARAIIKDPEVIFADEPTGALDQKTGDAVFSLLKEFSKEHLILAVTHDREFAEKYGDRIIELVDGEVYADSSPRSETKEEETTFSVKRARLPLKAAFKVGSGDFKFHPLRVVVAVILSAILLSIFSASFTFAMSTKESLSVNAAYQSGVEGTFIEKKENDQIIMLSKDDLDLMKEKFGEQVFAVMQEPAKMSGLTESEIPYYSINPYGYAFVNERQLDWIAKSINGSFPKSVDEVMIPRFIAEKLLFSKGLNEFSALLGTTIILDEMPLTICAVLDTGFNSRPYLDLKHSSVEIPLFNEFFNKVNGTCHNFIYFSDEMEIKDYSDFYLSMQGISKEDLYNIISMRKENFSYELNNYAEKSISEVKSLIESFHSAFIALTFACGGVSLAVFLYFVSQSISYQTELISCLKLLGLDKGNISRIFLCEAFLLGLMVFVLSISGCATIYLLLNRFLLSGLTLFKIGWIEPLLLFAVDIVCVLSGTMLPLRKLKNISPCKVLE